MTIQKILEKPHPFIFNRYSVLVPSFITFFVLLVLKPAEFDRLPTNQLIVWSALFSVLVGVTILFSVSIVKKYFRKTIEENWTVKSEVFLILFVLAVICLVVFALFLTLNPQANRFDLFSLVVLRTMAISFFPVLVLVLYEQNHHQNHRRQQAERLNQELLKQQNRKPQESQDAAQPTKTVIMAENQKIALQIAPMDLYFVKSDGNYVEVFYYRNREVQRELIRNSLKAIEEQLLSTDFFRCHNRFLVNLHHIQKVEGNARNLELVLERIDEKIPVSRNKTEMLLQLLSSK